MARNIAGMSDLKVDPDVIRDLHLYYQDARREAVDKPTPQTWMNLGIMMTLIMVDPELDCPLDGPCRWCDPDDLWRV